jgi:DNA-binding winged helix-turn-helix (wHTH) protein/tetratricopeptide (TPR) repeat protein
MKRTERPRQVAVFGAFHFDLYSVELKKNGVKLRLEDKPAQLLRVLIEHCGELVSRQELQKLLWPNGVHVDFEHGLNKSINKLRGALGDDAETPKYIETLSRRGYRFVAPLELLPTQANGHWSQKSSPPEDLFKQGEGVSVGPALSAAPTPGKSRALLRPAIVGIGLALCVLTLPYLVWKMLPGEIATTIGKRLRIAGPAYPRLTFQERDWVLISNFENKTGNPVFDGTLEYALERELSNSQFINVVPRERVDDALRLMRKPLDTKIDAALGRGICMRDGGIRALLTGRVEKLGTTYVMSAELVDPTNGVTVASLNEEDAADSQMAAAVRRLSNRVRETLGEKRALIQRSNQRLEKVTTPSLHALQLYTQANELILRDDNQAAAAELLERAIAEDLGFASAHLLLGWTYHNGERDPEAQLEFKRALDLADTTSDRERFFIIGSYYQAVAKETQKAIDAYETCLQLYPDHFWCAHNLAHQYVELGRPEDAARLSVRLADLSPSDLSANAWAAWARAVVEQDWNGAQRYFDRASELVQLEGESANPSVATWVKLFPVYKKWLQGNLTEAQAQLVQFERTSKGSDPLALGLLYETFGQLKQAEKYFQTEPGKAEREDAAIELAFLKGNWPEVKRHLPQTRAFALPGTLASVLMVRAEMRRDVEMAIRRGSPRRGSQITEGELALANGNVARGIYLLEQGLQSTRALPTAAFYLGSESLALTYRKSGRLDQALRVLQQASQQKARNYSGPDSFVANEAFWLRNELQLADLYHDLGRTLEAERVENGLRKMLIYADSDHPIVRELKKREQPQPHFFFQ